MSTERLTSRMLTSLCCALVTTIAIGQSSGDPGTRLLQRDQGCNDEFGWSVSLSSDLALIGAPRDSPGICGAWIYDYGSAYVFDVASGELLRKLTPRDEAEGRHFGSCVSLSGSRALIGAYGDGDNGSFAGAAYAFDAVSGVQQHKLLPADGTTNDLFGQGVASFGDLALIGAVGDDDHGDLSGSAYIFNSATGEQLHKLIARDGDAGDLLGYGVALSGDRALVGAVLDERGGSAYLFDVNTGEQLLKLTALDREAGDEFGFSVSLSGDLALVSAWMDEENGVNHGSVYVFDATTGQQLHKLTAPLLAGRVFGVSTALQGNYALIGVEVDYYLGHTGMSFGSAYLFDARTGARLDRLVSPDPHPWWIDYFGLSVALGGGRALVGAPWDMNIGLASGCAWVFDDLIPYPGTAYCFGDDGSGVCPCGNDNDGSVPGSGCDNGVFPSGAQLAVSGEPSVSEDSLALTTTHAEPNSVCLYLQADEAQSPPALWGDGLRCIGGVPATLEVIFADAAGGSSTTTQLSIAGGVAVGEVKYYQCLYRTVVNPLCGHGVNDFNATNGYSVTWLP